MADKVHLGWIGLGQMGLPMAERLLGEDVVLHVMDTNPSTVSDLVAKGAVAHPTPRSVADAAGIVFACLPSQEISRSVAFGSDGVAGGKAITTYVETSTIGTETIAAIATELGEKGIDVVDSPISGGPPAAREGRLAIMVSGPPAALDAVGPWIARIGKTVVTVGDRPGQGQVMKLVNNLVMAANTVVACEALVMGAKAGLDPDTMVDLLSAGTGASRALSDIVAPTALPRTFNFGAHLSILDKDVTLGVSEATALGVPVPVIDAARAIWQSAAHEGYSKRDFTEIAKFIEDRGGASIGRNKS